MKFLIKLTQFFLVFFIAFAVHKADAADISKISLTLSQSEIISLEEPVTRISVADPKIADITVINPKEVYLLGKSIGTTNIIFWHRAGKITKKNIVVNINLEPLIDSLKESLPNESSIEVTSISGSIILSGSVSNSVVSDTVINLSEAYINQINRLAKNSSGSSGSGSLSGGQGDNAGSAGGNASRYKVINLLKITDPQQVMLEVRIAEISKNLLEKLGVNLNGNIGGAARWGIVSQFLSGGQATANATYKLNGNNIGINIDAQKDDSLYKVLAEPTIVAMSGQEGSFLVGGRIYIPQYGSNGTVTTTEVPYGIGLKFIPIVLDKGRINLKVAPEVSEVSSEPITFGGTGGASTTVIPRILTKSASTTVQLRQGQSLVIGGLLSNNIFETVKAFPVLGEIPILGVLFRSKQFDSRKTELIVVVTPKLVSASNESPPLPTDNFEPPSRANFLLGNDLGGFKIKEEK
jgi:pilus assembly protein CpaC